VRSRATKSAQECESPSKAAEGSNQRTIQRTDKPDAVHNWRPVTLWPPPISIYHPVFAQFTHDVSADPNSVSFTSLELDDGFDIVGKFVQFYRIELHKQQNIGQTRLFLEAESSLLKSSQFMRGPGKVFSPNGYRMSHIPALGVRMPSEIIKLKSEIGEGGSDAVAQVECDYVCLHSSDVVSPLTMAVILCYLFYSQSLTLH
jgi:hypothetical protein